MTSYFFKLEGRTDVAERVEMRLDDPEEARANVVIAVGDLLRVAGAGFWNGPEWQINVTDEAGRSVCSLTVQGRAADAASADWHAASLASPAEMASVA